MTGAGIALPTEDAAEVDRRFATLEAELRPRSGVEAELVKRVALLAVRLDRSALHEAKAISHRMRKAGADFDDARKAEVEEAYSWIAKEPATHARRLRNSPEGIDRLLEAYRALLADLDRPEGAHWNLEHCDHLHHLMGRRMYDVPVTRARALTEAIRGNFEHLRPADRPELEKIPRQCWAANQMLQLIEAEIAALEKLRAEFDHEGLALDRAEAPHRAMFDDSKGGILARKYDATNERGFYRALRELREAQDHPEVMEGPEDEDELGSSLPEPPATEEAVADANSTDARGPDLAVEWVSGPPGTVDFVALTAPDEVPSPPRTG